MTVDVETRDRLLNRAVEFHGHLCRGLLAGFGMAMAAMERLGVEASSDEELIAIAYTENCGTDALQVVTSCTVGKGNLFLLDYGKRVFVLGNRRNNQAVRVALKPGAQQKIGADLKPETFFAIPAEELFKIEDIQFEFPPEATIFSSAQCARCGELVMEPRARVKEGQVVCLECFDDYPTRWK